jgi:hypothetical protein
MDSYTCLQRVLVIDYGQLHCDGGRALFVQPDTSQKVVQSPRTNVQYTRYAVVHCPPG